MANILQTTFWNLFFLNENSCSLIQILLKIFPKVPINTLAFVDIMAWYRTAEKP